MVEPVTTQMVYESAQNPNVRGSAFNTYDELSRLETTTDAANITVTNDYDEDGNLISVNDGKQQETKFVYDGLGRLTQTTHPDLNVEAFEYNAVYKIKRTDCEGQGTTYPVRSGG